MRYVILSLIVSVLPLAANGADIEAGRTKAQACTACHGGNGVSISDEIPNLAGQKPGYIVAQLKAFRAGTRKNPLMNAMAAQLEESDLENVAAYFNSLATAQASESSAVGRALAESKIEFPAGYRDSFRLYSKVNLPAQKRVRHNYANAAALEGPDAQGVFPSGAFVLTEVYAAKVDGAGDPVADGDGFFVPEKLVVYALMEKRDGWGEPIPPALRNGDWNYAIFTPDKSPKKDVNQAACLACHKPLDAADYLFSYKELVDAAR